MRHTPGASVGPRRSRTYRPCRLPVRASRTAAAPAAWLHVARKQAPALRAIALVFAAAVSCTAARAATYYFWKGTTGDKLWSTAANWSNSKVPTASGSILFDVDGETDCIVDIPNAATKALWVDGSNDYYGPYTNTITILPGCSLTVSGDFTVEGPMVVQGSLRVQGGLNYVGDGGAVAGDLRIAAGGVLEVSFGSPFDARLGTTFRVAGASGNPGIIRCTSKVGSIGNFRLIGNVAIDQAEFHNLNESGLQLLSDATHTVSASNVSFRDSMATTAGSQHLLVNGAAWDGYTFTGFSFEDGPSADDPQYAVENAIAPGSSVTFEEYDVSPGTMYGDPATDTASTGAVIWAPPDLVVVEPISALPADPPAGGTTTIVVEVACLGSGLAEDFIVRLTVTPVSTGTPEYYEKSVTSLAWGQSKEVPFAGLTSASADTWDVYATVDSTGVVTESNEANNDSGTIQVIWGGVSQPDLTITEFTVSEANPQVVGGAITVTATVKNVGPGTAPSSRVDLYYNRNLPPVAPLAGDLTRTFGSLATNETAQVVFDNITNDSPADWSMYVLVDPQGAITETDEGNNFSGPKDVTWEGVDLVITQIVVSESSPLMDGDITVTVTVENQGNVKTISAFDVGLYENPAGPPGAGAGADYTRNVGSLDPGVPQDVTFSNVTSSTAEDWEMYVVVDDSLPASDIDEYNEDNNVSAALPVTWRAPDLVIVSITPEDPNPTAGDTIYVDVVVDNQGDADAGPFTVGLYQNETPAPVPGGGADDTRPVASLAVDDPPRTVRFAGVNYPGPAAVTWQMYAIADDWVPSATEDSVDEGDESNNVYGPMELPWAAVDTDPDLRVVSATVSVDPAPLADPVIGYSVEVSVQVENTGTAASPGCNVGLYYHRTGAPVAGDSGDPPDKVLPVPSLAISETYDLTFTDVTSDTAGTWSMYLIVDCDDTVVTESNEIDNVDGPTAVIWYAPDLEITGLSAISGPDPDVGATITIRVTVQNLGDAQADAGSFYVALYFNEGLGSPSRTETVASLAESDGAVDVDFTGITQSAFATWNVYAVIDYLDDVLESDETNNDTRTTGPLTLTVIWHGPDLTVTEIAPEDASPDVGVPIWVDVTVRNGGDRDATNFVVALFEDLAAEPTYDTTASATSAPVALLAASGGETTVRFNGIQSPIAGDWSTWARVDHVPGDADGAVVEGDETKNAAGPVAIAWGGTRIDVVSPDGGETWVSGTTRQITWGSYGDVDWFFVMIEISTNDGATYSLITQSTLNDGSFGWTVPQFGSDKAQCRVRITPEGSSSAVADTSQGMFTIASSGASQADLRIVSLTPSSRLLPTSSPLAVDVTVRNDGNAMADFVSLDLYWSDTPPDMGDTGDASQSFLYLTPGAEHTFSFTGLTSSVVTVWELHAIVDTGGAVAESNEDNNLVGPVEIGWGVSADQVDLLTVLSPNGGERLEGGVPYTVTWDRGAGNPGAKVYVEISTDGGATWTEVARDVDVWLDACEWVVDAPDSDDCLLRISNYDASVSDVSDAPFTIRPEGASALLYIGEGCRAGAPAKSATVAALWLACLAVFGVIARRRSRSGAAARGEGGAPQAGRPNGAGSRP